MDHPKKTDELSDLLSGIIEHQQPLDGIPDDDQPLDGIPDDNHLDSSDEELSTYSMIQMPKKVNWLLPLVNIFHCLCQSLLFHSF